MHPGQMQIAKTKNFGLGPDAVADAEECNPQPVTAAATSTAWSSLDDPFRKLDQNLDRVEEVIFIQT